MIYSETFCCSEHSLKRLPLVAHAFHCIDGILGIQSSVMHLDFFHFLSFINNSLMNTPVHKFLCASLLFFPVYILL